MLGKLLRYEFKFYFRFIPILYLAMIVLGLIAGIGGTPMLGNMANLLPILIVAMFTVNIVMIIQRYRVNLLKDEGYLMFTLPVPSWSLIASKAIAALCTFLLNALAMLVSVLAYGLIRDPSAFMEGIAQAFQALGTAGTNNLASLLLTCLTVLITSVQQFCLIYAVMTAAQLLPRFRGIAGFAAYLVAMFLETRLTEV
ncbi:MAG: hypothetical protein LBT13_06165, partial [Treponema sp.]|nr:hypothetical protein [Treponema sp.]